MLSEQQAEIEIRRLRGLKGYRGEEAEKELIRVAVECSDTLTHLHQTVTSIVDESVEWPRPAELRLALQAPYEGDPHADDGEEWRHRRHCPFGMCVGDGWRVGYALHTDERGFVRKARLTKEQAAALMGKLGPQQRVYEGVGPCPCVGGSPDAKPAGRIEDGKARAAGEDAA